MYRKVFLLIVLISIIVNASDESIVKNEVEMKECKFTLHEDYKFEKSLGKFRMYKKNRKAYENFNAGIYIDKNNTNPLSKLIDKNATTNKVINGHLEIVSVGDYEKPSMYYLIGKSFIMYFFTYDDAIELMISSCNENWKKE